MPQGNCCIQYYGSKEYGSHKDRSINCIYWLVIAPMEKQKCLKACRFLKYICELVKYNDFHIWNAPCKIPLQLPCQAKCLLYHENSMI